MDHVTPPRVAVLYATDLGELSPGGIQSFLYRVGQHAPPALSVTYIGMGTPARDLPRSVDRFVSVGATTRGQVNSEFLRAILRARGWLAHDFDVLVVHRAEHVLALPRNVPTLLTLHGGTWGALRSRSWGFGIAYPALEALACRRAQRVISVAPDDHAWPAKLVLRGRLQATVVPAAEVFRDGARPPSRPDRLLTAARLVPEKRIERLIDLAARTGTHLRIFGDGPERSRLEELARRLGADVSFRGATAAEDLAREYSRGGIFCLSSAFEGFPVSAAEAATAGLPVMGVGSAAVKRMEGLGAISTTSVAEAADLLRNGGPARIDRDDAWNAFAPSRVAERYWRAVCDLISMAEAPSQD